MAQQQISFQSEALASATYDDETERLEITFTSGRDYTFEGVPSRVFEELRDAASPGRYFHQNIKGAY